MSITQCYIHKVPFPSEKKALGHPKTIHKTPLHALLKPSSPGTRFSPRFTARIA
jgi:hypothetical protein